ncbi:MAG: TetR/AcrR family transcriptional regulator [Actinobacteria bacterium]|nr:TetR/AcrR family transcriptional regulator [Actinomycetota bacterium]
MSVVKGTRGRAATEDVVAAAVGIADRDGVEAVTIRAVAAACGLSPMGIYRHVRDKDELLDRVVEAVAAEIADVEAVGPWHDKVVGLFRGCRRVLLDHPGVASLCVSRPTPVAGVAAFYDRVLAALREGAFKGPDAVRAFDTLLMFLFGSVLWRIPRRETEREWLIRVAVAHPDQTPDLIEQAVELARREPEEYFEHGLETILGGLEARRRKGGPDTRPH